VSQIQDLEPLSKAVVVAVLRAPDTVSALRGVDALVAGGVTGIEITYSTPDAPAVVSEVERRYGDCVVLGAGTSEPPIRHGRRSMLESSFW